MEAMEDLILKAEDTQRAMVEAAAVVAAGFTNIALLNQYITTAIAAVMGEMELSM